MHCNQNTEKEKNPLSTTSTTILLLEDESVKTQCPASSNNSEKKTECDFRLSSADCHRFLYKHILSGSGIVINASNHDNGNGASTTQLKKSYNKIIVKNSVDNKDNIYIAKTVVITLLQILDPADRQPHANQNINFLSHGKNCISCIDVIDEINRIIKCINTLKITHQKNKSSNTENIKEKIKKIFIVNSLHKSARDSYEQITDSHMSVLINELYRSIESGTTLKPYFRLFFIDPYHVDSSCRNISESKSSSKKATPDKSTRPIISSTELHFGNDVSIFSDNRQSVWRQEHLDRGNARWPSQLRVYSLPKQRLTDKDEHEEKKSSLRNTLLHTEHAVKLILFSAIDFLIEGSAKISWQPVDNKYPSLKQTINGYMHEANERQTTLFIEVYRQLLEQHQLSSEFVDVATQTHTHINNTDEDKDGDLKFIRSKSNASPAKSECKIGSKRHSAHPHKLFVEAHLLLIEAKTQEQKKTLTISHIQYFIEKLASEEFIRSHKTLLNEPDAMFMITLLIEKIINNKAFDWTNKENTDKNKFVKQFLSLYQCLLDMNKPINKNSLYQKFIANLVTNLKSIARGLTTKLCSENRINLLNLILNNSKGSKEPFDEKVINTRLQRITGPSKKHTLVLSNFRCHPDNKHQESKIDRGISRNIYQQADKEIAAARILSSITLKLSFALGIYAAFFSQLSTIFILKTISLLLGLIGLAAIHLMVEAAHRRTSQTDNPGDLDDSFLVAKNIKEAGSAYDIAIVTYGIIMVVSFACFIFKVTPKFTNIINLVTLPLYALSLAFMMNAELTRCAVTYQSRHRNNLNQVYRISITCSTIGNCLNIINRFIEIVANMLQLALPPILSSLVSTIGMSLLIIGIAFIGYYAVCYLNTIFNANQTNSPDVPRAHATNDCKMPLSTPRYTC